MPDLKPCSMCNNAKVDDELNSDCDLSYFVVGRCKHGFRILLGSGGGSPVRLIFERNNGDSWNTVGIYFPSFCPNCGRELSEYEKEGPNEEADLCG